MYLLRNKRPMMECFIIVFSYACLYNVLITNYANVYLIHDWPMHQIMCSIVAEYADM